MIKVGITGGIGSGKTTCCRIFETLGIPIYYADTRAKHLMTYNRPLKTKIKAHFGEGAYHSNGRLNRKYLSEIVFKDKAELQILNSLVHPAVGLDVMNWYESNTDVPYAIQEAALMVETGSYKRLDKLIVVSSPLELRRSRVMNRDKITVEAFNDRLRNQLPEKEKVSKADFVIKNDLKHSLIQQIIKIHNLLANLK